jgi:hypothetical protein
MELLMGVLIVIGALLVIGIAIALFICLAVAVSVTAFLMWIGVPDLLAIVIGLLLGGGTLAAVADS